MFPLLCLPRHRLLLRMPSWNNRIPLTTITGSCCAMEYVFYFRVEFRRVCPPRRNVPPNLWNATDVTAFSEAPSKYVRTSELAREAKTLQVTVGTFGLLPGGFSRSIISILGYTDVARDKEGWKERRGRKAKRERRERFSPKWVPHAQRHVSLLILLSVLLQPTLLHRVLFRSFSFSLLCLFVTYCEEQ